MPKTVAITGASGLLGTALSDALRDRGDAVRRLVRRPARAADEARWDPHGDSVPVESLAGADVVVHLAGKSIGTGRWTTSGKKEMLASRVDGTRVIAETLAEGAGPRAFISASATGIYGDRGDELLDEESAVGSGFLAHVCVEWEEAAGAALGAGLRVAHPRLGVVLSTRSGALAKMLPLFRAGLGGCLGSGHQYMPFVSLPDAIKALLRLVDDDELRGVFNLSAPTPATNRDLTKALGAALGRPTFMPAPAFGLRLAMGEMADEVLLGSQRVMPTRLLDVGFEFRHETVAEALRVALAE